MVLNERASSSRPNVPITTYVRQTPLFEENVEGNDKFYKNSSLRSTSLERFGIRPHSSRTKAFIHLLSDWEGRDALLQFVQSVSLLAYSMAPFQRRELHITSESLANARRILIVGRWLNEGFEALYDNLKTGKEADQSDSSSSVSISSDDREEDKMRKVMGKEKESTFNGDFHQSAIRGWQRIWQKRLGIASEYLTMIGEGCEVLAFLGGTSVMWRIVGNKLAARQRRGLERIAQFIFFFSFILTLRHMEHLRKRRLNKLRQSNQNLLRTADRLTDEADASTLLQADHLSFAEALSHDRKKSNLSHLQNYDDEKRMNNAYQDSALRRAEHRLFLQRKKMQLLKLEKTSVRAELIFVIAELFFPQYDHVRLEGWTTLIASLCHMSRLTKQTRWH